MMQRSPDFAAVTDAMTNHATPDHGTMPPPDRYPLLFLVNTRTALQRIGSGLGRQATLDDLDDAALAAMLPASATWVWFLGMWRTGEAAREISRTDPAIRAGLAASLPDLEEADIVGSCFAITGYDVPDAIGGEAALARLRARLAARGVRLMLDFIPNHTAPDHPWVRTRPDLYVRGDAATLAADPANWRAVETDHGTEIIALGRDPYFPGWPDTLQLDYANPETCARMAAALASVAARCDGARCDMAMLVLPEVIRRTWRREAPEFWPDATAGARRTNPGFLLMAEVYWGLEGALIDRGFDLTYDKGFYDALVDGDCGRIRARLAEPVHEQARIVRFVENHDEKRAAAVFAPDKQRAATVIALLSPGTRMFEQGQGEGARIHVSMHLGRAPEEAPDEALRAFHARLLDRVLTRPSVTRGLFTSMEPEPGWDGNPSHQRFVVMLWCTEPVDAPAAGAAEPDGAGQGPVSDILVAVNYGPDRGQCRVHFDRLTGSWTLADLMGDEVYRRSGDEMAHQGLFLDLPPWGFNVFRMIREEETET